MAAKKVVRAIQQHRALNLRVRICHVNDGERPRTRQHPGAELRGRPWQRSDLAAINLEFVGKVAIKSEPLAFYLGGSCALVTD